MASFKFALNDFVMLTGSAENGQVRARAEYLDRENLYYLRYVTAQGIQAEEWWGESALDFQPDTQPQPPA